MVTPEGLAISNFRMLLLQRPTLTRALYMLLLTTAIGGCITLGKKLQLIKKKSLFVT